MNPRLTTWSTYAYIGDIVTGFNVSMKFTRTYIGHHVKVAIKFLSAKGKFGFSHDLLLTRIRIGMIKSEFL